MRTLAALLILFGVVYLAYTMFLSEEARQAQRAFERASRTYIEAPSRVRESIRRDETGRGESEWSGFYKARGVVVSVSPGEVVIEEEGGAQNSYTVSQRVSLEGIREGDRVIFRRSGNSLVEIRTE